jgi:hypothetical protein
MSKVDRWVDDNRLLQMRRIGMSVTAIAESMNLETSYVIDRLNAIAKSLKPIDVNEIRHTIGTQIDDLIVAWLPEAMNGNVKAANFVLKAMDKKADLYGAKVPATLNVNINAQKPWEGVYDKVLIDDNNVIDGEVSDVG